MAWHDLVLQLARSSSGCKAIYDEWVEPDGYVSWHSFMGDVSRLGTALFLRGQGGDETATAEVQRILGVIEERLIHGDDDEDNAIHVSFLDMLPFPWEAGHGVNRFLGPRSRHARATMLNWKQPPAE